MIMKVRSVDPLQEYETSMVSVVKDQIESLQRRRFTKMEKDVQKRVQNNINKFKTLTRPETQVPSLYQDDGDFISDTRKQSNDNSNLKGPDDSVDIYENWNKASKSEVQDTEESLPVTPMSSAFPNRTVPIALCFLAYAFYAMLIYIRPDLLYEELEDPIFMRFKWTSNIPEGFGPVL